MIFLGVLEKNISFFFQLKKHIFLDKQFVLPPIEVVEVALEAAEVDPRRLRHSRTGERGTLNDISGFSELKEYSGKTSLWTNAFA